MKDVRAQKSGNATTQADKGHRKGSQRKTKIKVPEVVRIAAALSFVVWVCVH